MLALSRFAQAIVDPATTVAIDRQFIGRLERHDGFQVQRWTAPWYLVYLVHDGSCQVESGDLSLTAGPGQALLFRGDQTDSLRFSPVLRFSELRFRAVQADRELRLDRPLRLIPSARELQPILDRCTNDRLSRPEIDASLRFRLGLLLSEIDRLCTPAHPASGAQLSHDQRQQVIDWTASHLAHNPTPADLAQLIGYQADYFSRLFRRSFGCAPRDWLVGERMRKAARLLRDGDDPVAVVADQLGYASTAHFCRQFRQVIGCSPGAYRRQAP